jgi:hypothetical protein
MLGQTTTTSQPISVSQQISSNPIAALFSNPGLPIPLTLGAGGIILMVTGKTELGLLAIGSGIVYFLYEVSSLH